MTSATPNAIETMLNQDDEDFVKACYRALLLREADAVGLKNHLTGLATGTSKLGLLVAIADSEEARVKGTATSPLAVEARHRSVMMQKSVIGRLMHSLARLVQGAKSRKLAMPEKTDDIISDEAGIVVSGLSPVEITTIPLADWKKSIDAVRETRTGIAGAPGQNCFWFDLTTSFQWTGGFVGIVRAELEMACGLYKLCPTVRFSMQIGKGFAEINVDQIEWLLNADNVAEAYMEFFGRYKDNKKKPGTIKVYSPGTNEFFHPYEKGDLIFSMGWIDSQKEEYFGTIRQENLGVYIAYLIYDIITLLEETRHLCYPGSTDRFENYVRWISLHCDFILYGGETARLDTEAYLKSHDLPVPFGKSIKFGSDIVKLDSTKNSRALTAEVGITRPFILTVGSIEPRKNHETLYRAYLLAQELTDRELPQLIMSGKTGEWCIEDFCDSLDRDPRLKNNVIHCRPTDMQLAALYKDCLFTLLPSVYEGWSLTLPESLGQGKFCLCSDTPPLREIGGDLVDYIDPYDVRRWAEEIIKYSGDPSLLQKKEKCIDREWVNTRWVDSSEMVLKFLKSASAEHEPRKPFVGAVPVSQLWKPLAVTSAPINLDSKPTIWMDLTLSFLNWEGGVVGIVRAELTYAKSLMEQVEDVRFFAYDAGHFFEINRDMLLWLTDVNDLESAYRFFHDFWREHEKAGTGFRSPFRGGFNPNDPRCLHEITENSVVLFAGIDFGSYDENGCARTYRTQAIESLIKPDRCIIRSQIIYDYTPVLLPQFHVVETVAGYLPFVDFISNHFEHIIYGGRTAQRDGTALQKKHGWRIPTNDFIEFGSDIGVKPQSRVDAEGEREVLAKIGITGDFVMTVGTIQPRKNHEVLYRACLILLKYKMLDKPLQIVFAGKEGWKSKDLLNMIERDERVRGKIIVIIPSDAELDILYRHCQFTLLPSFYEGWSLTLPESLSYGKLALVADVDPLRETGGDLVEYIHPLDPRAWAEKMAFFASHPEVVKERERKIASDWHVTSWSESTSILVDMLYKRHKEACESLTTSESLDG